MTDTITAERFTAAVGHPPELDDLERSNCHLAGTLGHSFCGWCRRCDRPRFVCGHFITSPETCDTPPQSGPNQTG